MEDRTLLVAGVLDLAFDLDGRATTAFDGNSYARAVALDGNGRIVAAGYAANGGSDDFAVARYNSDGSLDTSFSGDGKLTTAIGASDDKAFGVAIDANGRIVVAGYSLIGFTFDFSLSRYSSDGTLDTSFDGDGIVTTAFGSLHDFATSIAIDGNGRIVVAGYTLNGGTYDFAVARYNTDGSLDTSFDGDGNVTVAVGAAHDLGQSVAIDGNGRIVVAGYSLGDASGIEIARLNSDGSLDTSFDGDGKVTTAIGSTADGAFSVAIDGNGKIVVAGTSSNGNDYDIALVRYNSDGSLDTSFGGDGMVVTSLGSSSDYAFGLKIDGTGRIVVAGSTMSGNSSDFVLARYNIDGSLDTNFDFDGIATTSFSSAQDEAYGLAIDASGRIIAAGYTVSSTYQFALARYTQQGDLTVSVSPASISEFQGTATGTVTRRDTALMSPLVVTLSSHDTTEATVPATVTIPANEVSATFPITGVDDLVLDGPQSVTISAAATGLVGNSAAVNVTDWEFVLTTSGALLNESGGGVTGTVSRVGDISSPVTVMLSSSDTTEATVLASVTIPANQASATFSITAADDDLEDGPRSVTITASPVNAPGYADSSATLTVIDDDSTVLLQDDFNDNALDPDKWRTNTSIPNVTASVTETNGRIELVNRGYLITQNEFDPVGVAGLRVTGRWTMLDSADFLAVLTRSDGVPQGDYGETNNGIQFTIDDAVRISEVVNGSVFELRSLSLESFSAGSVFDFEIFDDGTNLSFSVQQVGGEGRSRTALATSNRHFSSNHVVFHNREANNTAYLDDVVLSNSGNGVPGTLDLSVSPDTISEYGGTATVTVTRSNRSFSSPLLVTLGIASNDINTPIIPATITIPAQEASATFTVTAVDDSVLDGTRVAQIAAGATGYSVGNSPIFSITDWDFALTVNSSAMNENGGTLTGTVTRAGDLSSPLVVTLASSDTTAATVPATVTIAANQTSVTFSITAIDDALTDGRQSVTISADPAVAGYDVGTAVVYVADDEFVPLLQDNFDNNALDPVKWRTDTSIPNSSVSEVNGRVELYRSGHLITQDEFDPAVVGVHLTGRWTMLNTSDELSILTRSDGVPGGDGRTRNGIEFRFFASLGRVFIYEVVDGATGYIGEADTEFGSLPAGSVFDFEVTDDGGNVSFSMREAGGAGRSLSVSRTNNRHFAANHVVFHNKNANNTAWLDDVELTSGGAPRHLSLSLSATSFSEFGGTATGTVTRSNASLLSPLLVTLASNDTTEATVPLTVTIPAGETSVTFTINAVDDSILDGTQLARLTASATGFFYGTANVSVTDWELVPTLSQSSASESDGTLTGTITRAGGNLSDPLVVALTSSDTTEATVPATVTIPANQVSATFTISLLDDNLVDYTQHVSIRAEAPSYMGSTSLDVTDDDFVVLLHDDFDDNSLDPAKWRTNTNIPNVSAQVNEENGRIVFVNRGHLITQTEFDPNTINGLRITGRWTLLDVNDVLAVITRSDGTPSGQYGETRNGIQFTLSRALLEISENVNGSSVLLAYVSLGALSNGSVVDFEIIDDGAQVRFSIQEVGGAGTTASVTATSSRQFAANRVVFHNREANNVALLDDVVITGGHADRDYGDAPDTYHTLAANGGPSHVGTGPSLGSSRDLEHNGVPKAVADSDDLDSTDDEDGLVSFSNYVPGATATITVSVSGTGGKLDGWVDFDGSGTFDEPAERVTPTAGAATVPGDNTLSFAVPANAVTTSSYLRLRLSTTGGLLPTGPAMDGEVEDYRLLVISISPASISELDGTATGTVSRGINDISSPLVVTLTSSDTTEATVPLTVTIPAGQASATFTVTAVDDLILDGTQVVGLTGSAPGFFSVSSTLNVTDWEFVLTLDSSSISEFGGSATGTVTRAGDLSSAVVVSLSSSDTTEATVPATVTIPANESSASFTVAAVDDRLADHAQHIAISAAASGFTDVSAALDVDDDEVMVLLEDNFDDDALDSEKWRTETNILSFPASVAEQNGRIELVSRGHLITQGEFVPTAQSPLRVTGRWTMLDSSDWLSVVTRSDGVPAGDFGETFNGLEFQVRSDRLQIVEAVDGDRRVEADMALAPIAGGSVIEFEVLDYGFHVSFSIHQVGGNGVSGFLSGNRGRRVANHIVFHNREGNHTAYLDDVVVRGPVGNLTASVSLTTISEPGGVSGSTATVTVTRNTVLVSTPLVVRLSSNNATQVTIPPTVTIPANEVSATFTVTAIADGILDGPQAVSLSAGAFGFLGGSTTLSVIDPMLSLSLSESTVSERGGLATGTVSRGGDLSSALVVTLSSSDATEATAPLTVTIPAGQSAATFPVTAIDEELYDYTQNLSIFAAATGYQTASVPLSVTDDDVVVLLHDNFEDNALDPAMWQTSLPDESASVTEADGRIQFVNRGHLVTQAQFDPSILRVTGRWTMLDGPSAGSPDLLDILTRSDGVPSGDYGETRNGIRFRLSGLQGLEIMEFVNGVSNPLAETFLPIFSNGSVFDFEITDDGTHLSFSIQQVGGESISASVSATSSRQFAVNHVVFHNREANNAAYLDNVLLIGPAGPLTLSVNAASITEPGSVAGSSAMVTVTRNTIASIAERLIVELSSNDLTEATVPLTVTIPANQTSTSFLVSGVFDGILDGPQTVTLTATAAAFYSGTTTVSVIDPALTLAFSNASTSEFGGTATGTVTRGGDLSAPLVVTLISNDTAETTVPPTVTIPANQSSATFLVAAVEDGLVDYLQDVSVAAVAPGYLTVNTPLVVTATDEDSAADIVLSGADDNPEHNQSLTFTITQLPQHGTLLGYDSTTNVVTGPLSYVPDADYFGPDKFTLTETDDGAVSGEPLTTQSTINIAINAVNDRPTFGTGGNVTVDEDSGSFAAIWATEILPGPGNESAQSLQFVVTHDNAGLFAVQPAISSGGILTFTPASNAFGTAMVSVYLQDDGGTDRGGQDSSPTAAFTISVNSVNDQPVLNAVGNQTVNELATLSLTLAVSDSDGPAALQFSADDLPAGATLDSATGVFRWTPTEDQEGTYTITFTVTDGADSDSETVTLTVREVNQAPVLMPIGNRTVDEHSILTFTVSATDGDLPVQTLTYAASGLPAGATFDVATQTFRWTPDETQGDTTATVSFTVTDPDGASDTRTVDIDVTNVPTTTVTTVTSSGDHSIYGQSVTFTASVTGAYSSIPTGSVQFVIDGVNFGNAVPLDETGHATVSTNALPVAGSPHSIVAAYINDDDNFQSSDVGLVDGQTVIPFAFTYQIGNDSHAYGSTADLAAHLPATIATGINGENLAVTYASSGNTTTANVGSYDITGTLANGTGLVSNYNVTLASGTLTVVAVSRVELNLEQNGILALTDTFTGGSQNDLTLILDGTAGEIVIRSARADLAYSDNSVSNEVRISRALVTLIVIDLGAQDDRLNAATIDLPLRILTGGGNDSAIGGSGADTLEGQDGQDLLVGGEGHDSLNGGNGNDMLTGGAGGDTLTGGSGADMLLEAADFNITVTNTSLVMSRSGVAPTTDSLSGIELLNLSGGVSRNRIDASGFVTTAALVHTLVGAGGTDTIIGTNGRDRITTFSSGADSINGLDGNDSIFSGNGNDTVDGGAGNDMILGQNNDDSLLGGIGDDQLFGNSDNDSMDGGAGLDRLFGNAGNDRLAGGNDNDSLLGDAGNDSLNGGSGNDLLRGSVGVDDLDGGPGAFDRVDEMGDTNFTVIGVQVSSPLFGTETARNIERFDLAGGPGANVIDASRATVAVILNGMGGNDTLRGGSSNDLLFGGDGDDTLNGGGGNDRVEGGGGNDGLSGYTGNDSLFGQAGADALYGHDGADSVSGGDGDDMLVGGGGTSVEGDLADTLDGGNGIDTQDDATGDALTGIEVNMAFVSFASWIDNV